MAFAPVGFAQLRRRIAGQHLLGAVPDQEQPVIRVAQKPLLHMHLHKKRAVSGVAVGGVEEAFFPVPII
ncbi:hypothetical protein D3C75_1350980 [compost metagenome]